MAKLRNCPRWGEDVNRPREAGTVAQLCDWLRRRGVPTKSWRAVEGGLHVRVADDAFVSRHTSVASLRKTLGRASYSRLRSSSASIHPRLDPVRLLADENLPREAVEALRAAGHDVAWIAADTPSITDLYVLARACAELARQIRPVSQLSRGAESGSDGRIRTFVRGIKILCPAIRRRRRDGA